MKEYVLSVLFLLMVHFSCAQGYSSGGNDTVRITLQEAENRFLNNNLALIAQKKHIQLAEAELMTAKLYDNPEFSLSNSFYDPGGQRLFDFEINAEYAQLIRLAGKRKKEINLAKAGTEIATQEFYDMMRTLRYELRHTYYNIRYLQESIGLFDVEIAFLQTIVNSYGVQVEKGNVARMDFLRMQSQLYSLQAERDDLIGELNDLQSDFKILIRGNPAQFFVADVDSISARQPIPDLRLYQNLLDSAVTYRPDLKLHKGAINSAELSVGLQQANAKPDVTVSAIYQRLGGFVPNYNALGVSIPLPFFNRNQGNIRAAKTKVEIEKINYESLLDRVKNEITSGLGTVVRVGGLLQEFDPDFQRRQQEMLRQVTLNFQKGNISQLEFLDFYTAFKENIVRLNRLKLSYAEALERLNLAVGKVLFK